MENNDAYCQSIEKRALVPLYFTGNFGLEL